MAIYVDEEEVWRCPDHPSKHRRSGICPTCLRERLGNLCPDCASLRPCGCCASTATSSSASSSSSSSSLSRFFSGGGGSTGGIGSVGRVSNLIDSEPSFQRSRSVAVSLFRSRSRYANDLDAGYQGNGDRGSPTGKSSGTASFWGIFGKHKSKTSGSGFEEPLPRSGDESKRAEDEREAKVEEAGRAAEERSRMMRKSRSVAVTSDFLARGKRWSWYFPSPIKAFRQSKPAVPLERSPLYRG